MIAWYSSASRYTERFVEQLQLPNHRVEVGAEKPFILITPTFADAHGNHPVPKPVIRFLNRYRHLMVGVVGTGNRNFGMHFALGGRFVAYKCQVPLLHRLELSGTPADVAAVRDAYRRLFA